MRQAFTGWALSGVCGWGVLLVGSLVLLAVGLLLTVAFVWGLLVNLLLMVLVVGLEVFEGV